MLKKIDRAVGFVCRIVSGAAFCFMALVAFVDSIGRMLDRPLLGATEYVSFALLLFFFSSLAFVVRDDSQIRIGLFSDLYKPRLQRLEGLLTNIGELLALGLLTYMMWDQASRLLRFNTLSGFFKIPFAPWVYAATALSLAAIWFAVRKVHRQGGDPDPRPLATAGEDEI